MKVRLLAESRQLAAPPAPARPERIFHDATLREIARARPSSLDALRAISGMGARKAFRHEACSASASMRRKSKRSKQPKPAAKRVATQLRAVSDELGVTAPKTVRRSSAGVKQAPRSRPRKTR